MKNAAEKAVRLVAYLEAAKGKRSVIPIALEDVDAWLSGPQAQAAALMRLALVEVFEARPAPG